MGGLDVWVGPRESGAVAGVRKAHRPTRMNRAGRAHGLSPPIGEGPTLLMATCARVCLVSGETGVVEQMAPEVDLGRRHGVVGRHQGNRKPRRQVPAIRLRGATCPARSRRSSRAEHPARTRRPSTRRRAARAKRGTASARRSSSNVCTSRTGHAASTERSAGARRSTSTRRATAALGTAGSRRAARPAGPSRCTTSTAA